MAVVYEIKNKITGKKYIGKAINVERRWWEHLNNARRGKHHPLYDAISKYGQESFEFSILEEVSLELIDQREVELIKEHNTLHPNGYNLAIGGTGGNTRKGMSLEQQEAYNKKLKKTAKENIRNGVGIAAKSVKGKHITETCPEIAQKWKKNYEKGQQAKSIRYANGNFTDREKAGYRKLSTLRQGGNNPRAAKIQCVETGEVFNSMSEAVKYYGLASRMSIQTSIKTKRPSKNPQIKNLTFQYA